MTTRSAHPPESEGDDFGKRLESVFEDAHGELLGTLYYVVGSLENARDALQETFLKCWRHRTKCEDVVDVKAWVFRVALNTARDMRRAAWDRRRQPLPEDVAMISNSPAPEASLLRTEQLERLRRALLTLRPEEQAVFLLRQNGGLSYPQIAETLSLPLGTVKTRMRAAIGQLREAVSHD